MHAHSFSPEPPRLAHHQGAGAAAPRRLVVRERLLERLAGSGARIVLVSAPAGSGKTVLVRQWLLREGAPHAWLSLDADPRRFLHHLDAAFGTLEDAGVGRVASLLAESASLPPEAVVPDGAENGERPRDLTPVQSPARVRIPHPLPRRRGERGTSGPPPRAIFHLQAGEKPSKEAPVSRTSQDPNATTPVRYRAEVEGEIPPEWAAWFGAEALDTSEGRTRMELRVADQSQLHGVLRRIHDLHLQMVRLERLDPAPAPPRGPA
jgi:hypothetical protein